MAVSTLATSLALGGATIASADPASDLSRAQAIAATADQAVAAAQKELDRLHEELGAIEEEFAQARFAEQASRERADALSADVCAQQAKVDELRAQAADIARASFQNGGVDTTTQLFVSGDPESFLKQISTVAKVDENMNAVMQRFQAEQANLADLKRAADAELAKASEATAKAAELEARGKKNVADAQAVLTRLTAEQRQALADVEAAANAAAEAAAAAAADDAPSQAAASSSTSASTARTTTAAATTSSASSSFGTGAASSSAAAQAVAYARSKLGYPYVWAAEGPSAFDCSGLVVAAYRSAGVSLPHSSLTLSRMGTSVSRYELRPGDLIFWYNPVHHVAIYEGNGNMIHAQNPSVGVVRTPISQWLGYGIYYAGAKRVG
nr:hypothetical protein [Propionibacterium sp.]